MMSYLFGILAGVSTVLTLHAYLSYPLSLVALSKLHRKPRMPRALLKSSAQSAGRHGGIAILLCVHNEEKIIAERIVNLLAITSRIPQVEILVYSDGSTDRTAEILRKYAGRITFTVSEERHGKTYGMNQ